LVANGISSHSPTQIVFEFKHGCLEMKAFEDIYKFKTFLHVFEHSKGNGDDFSII